MKTARGELAMAAHVSQLRSRRQARVNGFVREIMQQPHAHRPTSRLLLASPERHWHPFGRPMGDISSKLPLFHVIGFTGHRQLDEPAKAAAAIRQALMELQRDMPGNWVALSSVAAGSDQSFVTEAKAQGLSWHAVLPLPHAEFAKDFTPAEWVDVETLLKHAEHVRVITENGTREDAYLDCGMEVVNSSDMLLALWDGKPARGRGGTADIISYARELGRPLLLIDAQTLAITRENFSSLKASDEHFAALNHLPAARTSWATNPFDAPEIGRAHV